MLHIAQGRRPEKALVLAAEVRRVVVAHAVPCARGVESFPQHQSARLLKPNLFLELYRAEARDRLEVKVESGNAHAQLARDVGDPQRAVELPAQPFDGATDAMAVVADHRDAAQPLTLLSQQKAMNDLPRHERREDPRFVCRGIEQADESHDGVQQARVERAGIDSPNARMSSRHVVSRFGQDRADEDRIGKTGKG